MKTRDVLQMIYGDSSDGFQTRLADIADSLVQAYDEKESRRMAEAEVRDQLAGYGPLLDQVRESIIAQQNEELTNSRLPAVLAFDAYCVMKDASKSDPSDRGLKHAAHALYDRWNEDPMGHLTVGELVSYRDHFVDMFPRSAAKNVFDKDIPEVGFNTLTNLPHLTRIASQVVDQDTYERVCEAYGLDGDRHDQVMARGWIKAIAELALDDSSFELKSPTISGTINRLTDRIAQEMEKSEDEQHEDHEMPEEAIMSSEEEIPHDEMSEEMATIESPISGEELTVELGAKEDEKPEGMEPEENEEKAPMGSPIPHGFEAQAQMEDLGGEETTTTITDPTSGEELELTLRPIKDEEPEEMGESEGNSMLEDMDEMGGKPLEMEGQMQAYGEAPEGWEGTVKSMKQHKDIDNPWALCLDGDIEIPCLDGLTRTVRSISESDEDVWVYGFDSTQHLVVPAKARARFAGNKKVVELTLSTGEVLRCSPEHRWVRRDGSFVEARDLKKNDSLMPFKTMVDHSGHERVYQPGFGSYVATHWSVMRSINPSGCKSAGYLIHHINEMPRDNRPENLVWMSKREHDVAHGRSKSLAMHSGFREKMQNDFEFAESVKERGSVQARKLWDDPKYREKMLPILRANAKKAGAAAGFVHSKKASDRRAEIVAENHKILDVVVLDENMPMFDVSVDDVHTFAVSAGVFSHNSHWMKNKGYEPHKKGEGGFDAAMNVKVPTQPGPMDGDYSDTDVWHNGQKDKAKGKKDKKEKKAQKLSREQVREICAHMGLTDESIEEQLLDGNSIAAGAYLIRIGSEDEIELRRLAQEGTDEGSKLIRSSDLVDFDGIVSDFMALTAAQFATESIDDETASILKAAGKVEKKAYVITSDVPHGAPINARRMMASVWKIIPDAEGELMDDGRLAILVKEAEKRDINRVHRVLSDVFGIENMEYQEVKATKEAQIQTVTPMNDQSPNQSPFNGKPPTQQQPAGQPMTPQTSPMQTPQTGSGAQQAFVARHTDPLQPQAEAHCGMEGCTPEEHMKHAQAEEEVEETEEAPAEGGDEMPPEDAAPPAEAPMDPSMGGAPGMPMGDPMMGGGMPGMMPMAPGIPGGDAMGMPDASQVPIDIGMGQLMPEDEMAVQAAMMHFRNMGMSPLEAIDKFTSAYSAMFDKYGDKTNPQRAMAEAAVIRSMAEAFARPSVVPAKKAGGKKAEMPSPRPPAQHPGKVTVSKDWAKGNAIPESIKSPPTQPGPMQGTYSKKDLGKPNQTSHSWGGDKKPGGPQKGSRAKQPGTAHPSTDVFVGTDGSGDSSMGSKMDSLSKAAPSTPQSLKKGTLVISFDADSGDFSLSRDEKKIAVHASLNAALADAERRKLGTDAPIMIDDGRGGFEEV